MVPEVCDMLTRERGHDKQSLCHHKFVLQVNGENLNMDCIKIDKYESVLESGRISYYAVAGKKKYPMPDCYKDMYTDDYLAIKETEVSMPELYDLKEGKHYIPLRTSA